MTLDLSQRRGGSNPENSPCGYATEIYKPWIY